MTTLADIRAQYPQYKDVPDDKLADAFYQKFYAGKMSQEDFNTSIGYNATPAGEEGWLTPVDDTIRTIADTATRGYADKAMGAEEQQHTARSRERLPDYVEMPLDIATGVLTSPFRAASAGYGALTGGIEGAADAYGHQEGWVPDAGGVKDILKGGAIGAGVGGVTGGLGDVLGRWTNIGKKGFKSDEELFDAAKMARSKNLKGKADLTRRAEKAEAARLAQTKGQAGFQEMLAGMDKADKPASLADTVFGGGKKKPAGPQWDRRQKELISSMANRETGRESLANVAGTVLTGGGGLLGPLLASKVATPLAPVVGAGLKGLSRLRDKAASANAKDYKELMEGLRGYTDDPAGRDALSVVLNKLGVSGAKAYENRR